MAWATDQTFQAYHLPEVTRLESRNYRSERVVTMPAADVRAGNTYAFILTGILGAFTPTGFSEAICEVALQAGTGTIYDNSRHRQDMTLAQMQTSFGQPFMTIVVVPSASAVDYSMVYRADSGFASIDAPCLQVWDLTEIGASGALTANMTTPTSFSATAAEFLQGPTLGLGRQWLVYWSAEIEQKAWYENALVTPPTAGLYLTRYGTDNFDANTTRTYFSGTGPILSHIGCGPRAETKARLARKYTRLRVGDWVVLEDALNPQYPAVWGLSHGGVGSGYTDDVVQRLDMVCIDLGIAASGVETQRVTESARAFPGDADDLIGSREAPRSQVRAHTTSYAFPKASTAVLGTIRSGSYARGVERDFGVAVNHMLEVDGSHQSPRGWVAADDATGYQNTLYVLLRDVAECLPTHRILTPQLDAGGHCYRWWGRHNLLADDQVKYWPNFYDATWLQLLGTKNFTATAPILETAGPEVAVAIRRESLADVSSLPELPDGFSDRVEIEVIDPVEDFRAEGGYLNRLPRFAAPRQAVRLQYTNLSTYERGVVEGFLRELADTHGCFRATLPDALGETGFVLDVAGGWRGAKRGSFYSLEFRAFELLYMAT